LQEHHSLKFGIEQDPNHRKHRPFGQTIEPELEQEPAVKDHQPLEPQRTEAPKPLIQQDNHS